MTRRLNISLQPAPKTSLSGDAASRSPAISKAIGSSGPDTGRVPVTGDHRDELVDVGADFFSAAELAALKLDGLPHRRDRVSKLATRQGWSSRDRQGRGGGREFALAALPAAARGEILRRRLVAATSAGQPNGAPLAPLPIVANLKSRQAERLTARSALLAEFDRFKGSKSDRASLDAFVAAVAQGHVALPEWTRPLLTKLSRRTLERWLAARKAGRTSDLVDRYSNCGRKSVFDLAPELAEFVLGAHAKQPLITANGLAGIVRFNFPNGVADRDNILHPLPSAAAIARFLKTWKSDALNANIWTALNDPDRWRSKYRFAFGNAAAGVDRPNQRWQIDASPADRIYLDGRINIYVAVDVFSRRVMALVSKTPKTIASLLLIARACQAWGMPEEIWTDNGSDFTSKHFVTTLHQLGIHHHLTKPFSPEQKGHVERAIGTIQHSFMPMFENYSGRSVAMRSQIEQRRAFAARLGETAREHLGASADAADLQDELSAWVANIYEKTPHSGLGGRAPIDVWSEAVEQHPPRFAPAGAIGLLLMPPARDGVRTVTAKGLAVEGIDYIGPDLIVGQRVQVRLDPDDLGKVWVYTDTDPMRFVCVAKNPELEGTDRAEAAMRVRALQAEMMKQGKVSVRALMRKADVHGVARRMIGEAPALPATSDNVTYLTPALEEAVRAVRSQGRRQIPEATEEERAAQAEFVAAFEAPAPIEEQPHERYTRWKALKAEADAGAEISADDRHWLQIYPTTGEWKAHRMVEQDSGA